MKRILAILCVIACLCGLCVPAMAAGTITVSVKAPADWAEVRLYVWEGETPLEGWPGSSMTKGADGLWTLEIPAGSYTNVIANNGSDAGKTGDLKMDGSADCWIDAATGTVYTDAGFSKPFAPAVSTDLPMALVGSGIPGVVEWNPGDPSGDMTKVSDGVYTKIVSATAGTTMTFKVAGNDKWDNTCNFGSATEGTVVTLGAKVDMISAGDSKDMTLTVDKDCNLKFTVTLVEGGATLLVEETDEEPTTNGGNNGSTDVPAGEKITVYAKFPADWKGACVWAWKEPGPVNATNAAWPGDLYLVKGENGWWSVQVPNWVTGILINANGGGVQTPDIKGFEVGKDIWINAYTDPQNPVYSHEEITDIVEPTTKPPVEATIRPTEGLKDNNQNNTENKGGKDLTVLLSIIGSVVIIAIAAVVVIIVKSKKKAA